MENERASQAWSGARGRGLEALTPLVLASSSPRRAEILRAVGWPFEASPADVDETRRAAEAPEDYVRRLAREKAEAVASQRLFGLVLGALHRRHRRRLLERRRPARAVSLRDGAAGDAG